MKFSIILACATVAVASADVAVIYPDVAVASPKPVVASAKAVGDSPVAAVDPSEASVAPLPDDVAAAAAAAEAEIFTANEPEPIGRTLMIRGFQVKVRQAKGRVGIVSNEFTEGGCKDVIMIFARGSTEPGNMGTICGPPTADGVKAKFKNTAVEGVEYAAGLTTNLLPGGADPQGVAEMKKLIAKANTECPDSKLVVGGYSQGAAVTHSAVEDLPQAQKDQIVAAFLFGDTQFQQENGQIANFPPAKTKIICQPGDAVCKGTLVVLPAHLSYGSRSDEMADFINQKLTAAGVQP